MRGMASLSVLIPRLVSQDLPDLELASPRGVVT